MPSRRIYVIVMSSMSQRLCLHSLLLRILFAGPSKLELSELFVAILHLERKADASYSWFLELRRGVTVPVYVAAGLGVHVNEYAIHLR